MEAKLKLYLLEKGWFISEFEFMIITIQYKDIPDIIAINHKIKFVIEPLTINFIHEI